MEKYRVLEVLEDGKVVYKKQKAINSIFSKLMMVFGLKENGLM
jgi:hypothetical protein